MVLCGASDPYYSCFCTAESILFQIKCKKNRDKYSNKVLLCSLKIHACGRSHFICLLGSLQQKALLLLSSSLLSYCFRLITSHFQVLATFIIIFIVFYSFGDFKDKVFIAKGTAHNLFGFL